MMVEAGGTEKAWTYYEAGAPKVTEAVIAEGLEACKTWIRESIELQTASWWPRPACRAPLEWVSQLDYADEIAESVARDRREPARRRRTRSPTRPSATPPTTRSRPRSSASSRSRAPSSRAATARSRRRSSTLTKTVIRRRVVERRRAHRRPRPDRPPPGVRRGRHPPDRARLGPVPAGRDPGAQRPDARHAEDGPDARHARHRDQEALHAPLQHAALRQRRDRPHGWHQAPRDRPRPARRAGPAAGRAEQGGVALRPAPRVRGAVVQRLHLDGVGVRVVACR